LCSIRSGKIKKTQKKERKRERVQEREREREFKRERETNNFSTKVDNADQTRVSCPPIEPKDGNIWITKMRKFDGVFKVTVSGSKVLRKVGILEKRVVV